MYQSVSAMIRIAAVLIDASVVDCVISRVIIKISPAIPRRAKIMPDMIMVLINLCTLSVSLFFSAIGW